MGIVSEAERTERKRRYSRQHAFGRSMLQMAERIQSGFSAGDLLFSMEFFGVSGPVQCGTMKAYIADWIRRTRNRRNALGLETRYICAPGLGPAGPLCRVLLNCTGDEDSKILLCDWVSDKISMARLEHPVYPQEVAALLLRGHLELKSKYQIHNCRWSSSRFHLTSKIAIDNYRAGRYHSAQSNICVEGQCL